MLYVQHILWGIQQQQSNGNKKISLQQQNNKIYAVVLNFIFQLSTKIIIHQNIQNLSHKISRVVQGGGSKGNMQQQIRLNNSIKLSRICSYTPEFLVHAVSKKNKAKCMLCMYASITRPELNSENLSFSLLSVSFPIL